MTQPSHIRHTRPLKQARSARTLDRLLDAAQSLLAEDGLEAATVPAVAARAGLSVGAVYRRFRDKDAVLRAVYERFFTRNLERNRKAFDVLSLDVSLESLARRIVGGMVAGYRVERGLLRALNLYADSHPDPRFRRRAHAYNGETLERVGALLLARGKAIRHPDPEAAISFGLITVASTLRVLMLGDRGERMPAYVPTHLDFADELTRGFLGYLGVASEGVRVGPGPAPARAGRRAPKPASGRRRASKLGSAGRRAPKRASVRRGA